jgi:hypothetical protein
MTKLVQYFFKHAYEGDHCSETAEEHNHSGENRKWFYDDFMP